MHNIFNLFLVLKFGLLDFIVMLVSHGFELRILNLLVVNEALRDMRDVTSRESVFGSHADTF